MCVSACARARAESVIEEGTKERVQKFDHHCAPDMGTSYCDT